MSAADRVAVHDLLVGYFCGFDERRTDDAFLRETFTADAHWRFPRGDATGIEEIIERRDGTLGLWKETLLPSRACSSSWLVIVRDSQRRFWPYTFTARTTPVHRSRSAAG
jgi:SnoaL-like domain